MTSSISTTEDAQWWVMLCYYLNNTDDLLVLGGLLENVHDMVENLPAYQSTHIGLPTCDVLSKQAREALKKSVQRVEAWAKQTYRWDSGYDEQKKRSFAVFTDISVQRLYNMCQQTLDFMEE